jgi:hypothetical protein
MGSTATTKAVTCGDGTTIAYDRAGFAIATVGGGPTDPTANTPVAALLCDRFTVYSDDRGGRGESGDIGAYAVERGCTAKGERNETSSRSRIPVPGRRHRRPRGCGRV